MTPARPDAMQQALRWLVILQDDAVSDHDHREFAKWLAEDSDHADAWRRAKQVWEYAAVAEPAFREARSSRLPPSMTKGQSRWWLAIAASVAVLAVVGTLMVRPDLLAQQRTALGERRVVTLSDGSQVEMGSATSLSATMAADRRRVILYGGEAFFTVAPDPSRPFEVEARNGRIRALGTAFDVKETSDGYISVAVAEHAVAVTVADAPPVEVGEGGLVRYGPNGVVQESQANLRLVQAWRRDRLVFQEATLREVVAELGRYRAEPILITDDRVAALSVTAVFDTTRTDEALQTIAATLPVRVTHVGGLLTLIRPNN